MRITYAVSMWNYTHYTAAPSLERCVKLIREQGWGIEFWGGWRDEQALYDEVGRERLKPLVEGMTVSLHTAGARTQERMQQHVDTAAHIGAGVIVLHPTDVCAHDDANRCDLEHTKWAVDYAEQRGVRLALENGHIKLLRDAIRNTDGLGFCFDVGHPYFEKDATFADFVREFKNDLIHIHLQDTLPEAEKHLPATGGDHYILGTGGIPAGDWALFKAMLEEVDYVGTGVFEIRPRNPLQTALLGKACTEDLLAG